MMNGARAALIALGLTMVGLAVAASDPRGWSEGQVAAGAAQVLGPRFDERVPVPLPEAFAPKVTGPTLLVYVSPTCPHCLRVAPEIGALAKRLGKRATVIGVVTSHATPESLTTFRDDHGWDFEVVHDTDGAIAASMAARSTPSAMLVTRDQGEVVALDAWYPYRPGSDVLVEMRVAKTPFAAFTPGAYMGNTACGSCHTQEHASWLLTHHSVAWRTLVRGDKTDDPACVGCHVTGHEQPGGWDGTSESHLVDVGCEACHGPGGPHDGTRTDATAACAGCHDAKHSLDFQLAKAIPHIDHFRSNALDDEGWRAARTELLKGEAPRPLIGFDEGTYVGSAACASCHEAEHASWASSPHGGAMTRLVAQGQGAEADAACVRCHATPKTVGPPATDVAGFRTDEGVGCESCHGPGGQHVAAKGAPGTIEGLGEECPVCVLEAICTSCHTSAWDPTWSLDTRLEAARHARSASKP